MAAHDLGDLRPVRRSTTGGVNHRSGFAAKLRTDRRRCDRPVSPCQPDKQNGLQQLGTRKYDPRFNIDGINDPVVIPPAFGLADVALEMFTGDGPISYWNNYVAVTQMGGRGVFIDPRIGVSVMQSPDLVTPKLPALRAYQSGLSTPPPPDGIFDATAVKRGEVVFHKVAKCATCHIPPTYSDINFGIWHDPSETGMDPTYASRTATGLYRTTPLRALWQHPPYFHDGSAATLDEVVMHYVKVLGLRLSRNQQRDLVEFLKTL